MRMLAVFAPVLRLALPYEVTWLETVDTDTVLIQ